MVKTVLPRQVASVPSDRGTKIPRACGAPSQDEALSRYSASGEVPRSELEVERALGTLDATHKVPRNPGLLREEH